MTDELARVTRIAVTNEVALLKTVPVRPKSNVNLAKCMEAGNALARQSDRALLPVARAVYTVSLISSMG